MKMVYRAPPPYSADAVTNVISESLSSPAPGSLTATETVTAAAAASSNPVHWQTAFWAIATVALNSITQDSCSETVLLYPRAYSELIRSSPVFCVLDNLYKVVCVIYLMLKRQIALPAAIRLATTNSSNERHPTPATPPLALSNDHDEQSSSSSSSNKSAPNYWIPLLLRGTILVAACNAVIKIMAFEGLPWTQAFCMLYFVTYLLEWIWMIIGHYATATLEDKYNYESALPPLVKIGSFIRACAVILQVLLWIALVRNPGPSPFDKAADNPAEDSPSPFNSAFGVIWFIATFIVMYIPYIYSLSLLYYLPVALAYLTDMVIFFAPPTILVSLAIWLGTMTNASPHGDDRHWLRNVANALLALVAFGGSIAIMVAQGSSWGFSHASKVIPIDAILGFTMRLFLMNPGYNTWEAITAILAASLALVLVWYALFESKISRLVPVLRRLPASDDTFWICNFFFLNLCTCLFYYARYYDETNTWAPAWLSRLP